MKVNDGHNRQCGNAIGYMVMNMLQRATFYDSENSKARSKKGSGTTPCGKPHCIATRILQCASGVQRPSSVRCQYDIGQRTQSLPSSAGHMLVRLHGVSSMFDVATQLRAAWRAGAHEAEVCQRDLRRRERGAFSGKNGPPSKATRTPTPQGPSI
jgi:hypothetical protein